MDVQKTLFIVAQHGGEVTPLKVVQKYFQGKVKFLIANPQAVSKNKRFIETDLNRSFPGRVDGSLEEKIAFKLKKELKKYQFVLDFHTTTVYSPMFIITTSLDKKYLDLINKLDVQRVVFMEESIANGHSLIDFAPLGVSLEVGAEGSKEAFEAVRKVMESYIEGRVGKVKKEYYSVFGVLQKKNKGEKLDRNVQSFKLVKKGDLVSDKQIYAYQAFYPIMPGEKSYKGVLTLMARKLSKEQLSARIGK